MNSGDIGELITIGRVLKPKGLKGELRIRPMAGFPDNPHTDLEVYVEKTTGQAVPMRIEHMGIPGRDVIVKFSGVDDRTAAEALHGADICIRSEKLAPLPDGSFYPFELIGAEVTDESGTVLGTLVRIENFPAQDVLVIASGNKAFMAPAAREFFISFDRNARRLVLRLPEGLPDYTGEL